MAKGSNFLCRKVAEYLPRQHCWKKKKKEKGEKKEKRKKSRGMKERKLGRELEMKTKRGIQCSESP